MSQSWNYLLPTPPGDLASSVVKACYQFDGPTAGFTDRSGNGHTLSASRSGYGQAWMAAQSRWGCNCFMICVGQTILYSAKSAALGTLGVGTLEFVGSIVLGTLGMANEDNGIVGVSGRFDGSSGESRNTCFSIFQARNNFPFEQMKTGVAINYGSNVWEDEVSDEFVPFLPGHLSYVAVTRASDGKTYKLYFDGEHIDTFATSNAPTGATDVAMGIGAAQSGTTDHSSLLIQSARWSHAEYTAEQVLETYDGLRV